MIAIIDYGLGNLGSVKNALDTLQVESIVTSDKQQIEKSDGIIFPGVGAAGVGMKNLRQSGLDKIIKEEIKKNKPFLGICLGMQLLFSYSEENDTECLNIISGQVRKFDIQLKIPHIGWNQVKVQSLFSNIPDNNYFYFVHSYYCDPADKTIVSAQTDYGIPFCSAIQKNNIYATQFHPEKSGQLGLQLLKTFSQTVTNYPKQLNTYGHYSSDRY